MKSRSYKEEALAVLAVAALYLGMAAAHLPCPIRFFTGVSCAGCGMTRAWLALLRLDLAAAFAYHPLCWLPPLAVVLYLARRRLPARLTRLAWGAIVAAFLAVYLYRLWLPGDGIVVFAPTEGFFARLLRALVFRAT